VNGKPLDLPNSRRCSVDDFVRSPDLRAPGARRKRPTLGRKIPARDRVDRPYETSVMMAHLVFAGYFDRWPI
jgi:hypothetical protein